MNATKAVNLRVGLVIPVFNVEKTIAKVLGSITTVNFFEDVFEILIIDNHSDDKTLPIIHEYLMKNPEFPSYVTIIQHKENYGYGCSVKAGFEYFSTQDVSHVMVIHGDYQVEPAWLMEKLLGTVKLKPDTDIVLASRFKPESNIENYSTLRKFGNYFFNTVTTFCSGHRMSDSGTAMIIVRNDILQGVPFRNLSNSWQFHPQLNILLYEIPNVHIEEIPMNWADSDATSTVPLLRYGLALLKMLLLYWLKKTILGKSPQEAFPSEYIPLNRQFVMVRSNQNGQTR